MNGNLHISKTTEIWVKERISTTDLVKFTTMPSLRLRQMSLIFLYAQKPQQEIVVQRATFQVSYSFLHPGSKISSRGHHEDESEVSSMSGALSGFRIESLFVMNKNLKQNFYTTCLLTHTLSFSIPLLNFPPFHFHDHKINKIIPSWT